MGQDRGPGPCTIGPVLNAIGDKWSLRVLWEVELNGVSRFSDFQAVIGLSPDILGQRLSKLMPTILIGIREVAE